MSFRVALGRCDCTKPFKDGIQKWACGLIEQQLCGTFASSRVDPRFLCVICGPGMAGVLRHTFRVMRDKASLTLSDPARKKGIASIKRFFAEQLDDEIGDLKAMLVLDYILAEHGPSIYNLALADARAFVEERAADVEGLGYPQEFPSLNAPKRPQ